MFSNVYIRGCCQKNESHRRDQHSAAPHDRSRARSRAREESASVPRRRTGSRSSPRPAVDRRRSDARDGASTLARALAKHVEGRVRSFPQFLTYKVIAENWPEIDIATARTEKYRQPGALPSVSPGKLRDDLMRRDFSINAMAMDLTDGSIHDPAGGEADLRNRIVRVLHDQSFIDDPTRIFRAVRLATRLGFTFDETTSALMRAAIDTNAMSTITKERIWHELFLAMDEAEAPRVVAKLSEVGALSELFGTRVADPAQLESAGTQVARNPALDRYVVYTAALLRGDASAGRSGRLRLLAEARPQRRADRERNGTLHRLARRGDDRSRPFAAAEARVAGDAERHRDRASRRESPHRALPAVRKVQAAAARQRPRGRSRPACRARTGAHARSRVHRRDPRRRGAHFCPGDGNEVSRSEQVSEAGVRSRRREANSAVLLSHRRDGRAQDSPPVRASPGHDVAQVEIAPLGGAIALPLPEKMSPACASTPSRSSPARARRSVRD